MDFLFQTCWHSCFRKHHTMHKVHGVPGGLKISGAPSSKLTTRDVQECAEALFGHSLPGGFQDTSPTSPSGVMHSPTPVSASKHPVSSPSSTVTQAAPQTPRSTRDVLVVFIHTHRDVVQARQANLGDASGLLCRQNRRSQRVCPCRHSSVEAHQGSCCVGR
jgi:hypothetical protein